ncbi:protein kinase [Actinomadura fulvescens]|uniref:Protein kinase n=1 Tax=Actinomadura fulvescens TaxID=46160 RepID=A0ABN3QD97_9ACTN
MSPSLPGSEFTALIHPHTGDVSEMQPTSRGNNSAVTALVDCEKGAFFVKAVPNRPGGRRDSLIREGLINPFVVPISPALRWQAEDSEWIALGFEVIEGRRSDFTPGSADLPAIIDILNRIGELYLPEIAQGWHETRWNRFATEADAELFQGQSLLYTDINPDNLLIGQISTWAVDWSWPTHGAAFIDPACLVVQLIAAGHDAGPAETWAAECAAWTNADRQAIDAFAAANLRMYRRFADRNPDATWLQAMATAAHEWAAYRDVPVDRDQVYDAPR